eukprot:CAMPEP_0185026256 /NCGR_PEP_ID=MMETSP1103-20130426/10186_1 /TAXON_ID=36769 /ORGANISM="Paraphysomonas bandaiensis, Strain Caron Lab Isolate" /LENGTH=360 /DNA_ID=CAMNT_0027559767 /DNA_START=152 /DNA_END=1234 /DNA_ORIENTATION=-
MRGYSVSDFHKNHVFTFPDDFRMEKLSFVRIYTCPGRMKHSPVCDDPYLLWTNNDGSLRKKEILNNDGDTVYLFNANGVKISSCSQKGKNAPVIETVSSNHPKYLIFLRAIALCCYLRLFFLALMIVVGCYNFHSEVVDCFLLAMAFDFFSRLLCSWLHGHYDRLDIVSGAISSVSDRLSTFGICLASVVSLLSASCTHKPNHQGATCAILATVCVLDVAAHWMRLLTHRGLEAVVSDVHDAEHDAVDFLKAQSLPLYSVITILGEVGMLVIYSSVSGENGNLYDSVFLSRTHGLQDTGAGLLAYAGDVIHTAKWPVVIICLLCVAAKQGLLFIQLVSSVSKLSMEVLSQRTKENVLKSD